jgi:hypothetical protein
VKAPLNFKDPPQKIALWVAAAWYPLLALLFPERLQKPALLAALGMSLAILLASTTLDFSIWGMPSWGFFLGNWVSGLVALSTFVHLPKEVTYFYLLLVGAAIPALLWQMWERRRTIPADAWAIFLLFLASVAASELAMVPASVLSRTALIGMLFFGSLEMFAISAGMLHAASHGARSVAVAAIAESFIGSGLLMPDYGIFKPFASTALTAIESVPLILIPVAAYFRSSDRKSAWISWGISAATIAAVVGFRLATEGFDPDALERLVLVALPCILATLLSVRIYPALDQNFEAQSENSDA